MEKAKSLSAQWGIPQALVVNDAKRYPNCDAHEAILQDISPDGRTATYKGVCAQGHIYREEMEVEELRRKTKIKILNGKQVYTLEDDKVNSGELEEF